jgi:hypothetical protein
MSSWQAVHDLMAQVGPVLELQQVTEFAEDRTWCLVFDESTGIDVDYDERGDRLVLTANVAAVEAPAQAKSYEALLRYNYLWSEHGGVRAALDGAPGKVVFMIETPVSGLEISKLCNILQGFRAVVEGWRGVLASIASGGTASDTLVFADGMIRV